MTRPQSHGVQSAAADEPLRRLSRRQRDIAERYAKGLTYKQIAAELFIAPATVRNHLATIYRELGIGNKADLVRLMAAAPDAEGADGFAAAAPEHVGQPADRTPETDGYALKAWLQALSLDPYIEMFAANAIDWQTLPMLDDHDLQALGIRKIGHRKKLLQAIAELAVDANDEVVVENARPIPASDQPERRHLTVMFCDLVGSTTLAERFDPEDLSDLIHTYQTTCARAIEQYDGHIDHVISGSILVFFGYPQAHEDDAERALRAGLAIIEAIGQLGLQADVTLQVRIGVAAGTVVVGGSGVGPELAVIGQTPDVAAKLLSLAACRRNPTP